MRIVNKTILLLTICIFIALGFGCNKSNGVKLTYALGPAQPSCPGEAIIFKFEDKRSRQTLGVDSNGKVIPTLSDVSDWVGWALFDELRAAGCDVKYRTSTVAPGDTPLITGEVLDASLNQTGTTTYAGKVTVKVILSKGGETVHIEKFTSEVEDLVVPGYGDETGIMAEALRGLLAEAVPTICRHL